VLCFKNICFARSWNDLQYYFGGAAGIPDNNAVPLFIDNVNINYFMKNYTPFLLLLLIVGKISASSSDSTQKNFLAIRPLVFYGLNEYGVNYERRTAKNVWHGGRLAAIIGEPRYARSLAQGLYNGPLPYYQFDNGLVAAYCLKKQLKPQGKFYVGFQLTYKYKFMRNKWAEYSWGDYGVSHFHTLSYAHVGYADFIMGAKHHIGKNACLDLFFSLGVGQSNSCFTYNKTMYQRGGYIMEYAPRTESESKMLPTAALGFLIGGIW
jgi:hypothetical protein